jgi:hypothetical protein
MGLDKKSITSGNESDSTSVSLSDKITALELNTYSPAELLLLIKAPSVTLSEAMGVTLMDLLLKMVVKVKPIEVKSRSKVKPVRIVLHIKMGMNISTHIPKEHERYFLHFIQRDYQPLQLYLRNVYDAIPLESTFERDILANGLKNLMQRKSYIFFSRFSFSKAGKAFKEELKQLFAELAEKLPNYIQNDKMQAINLLEKMGGTIFLIENINLKSLNGLHKELLMDEKLSGRAFFGNYYDYEILNWVDSVIHSIESFTSGGDSGDFTDIDF